MLTPGIAVSQFVVFSAENELMPRISIPVEIVMSFACVALRAQHTVRSEAVLGSITGLVVNSAGVPVPGHLVAYRTGARDGFPTLFAECAADTDPDGHYTCTSVAAGNYIIMVRPNLASSAAQAGSSTKSDTVISPKATTAYATTFYPQVTDIDNASTLPVRAGESAFGRVVVASLPVHSVSIELPVNTAASSVNLATESQDFDLNLNIPVAREAKSGKYIVENLPEGRYVIKGDWFANGTDHRGFLHLQVNASTQKSQTLEESFPVPVSGSVHNPDSLSREYPPALLLETKLGDIYHKHYEAKINPEGEFHFPAVEPGEYVLRVLDGQKSYIATSSQNGRPAANQSIVVPNIQRGLSLSVEIKSNSASLSGVVSEAEKPAGGAGVMVQSVASGEISIVKANDSGQFRLEGLAAGDYRVMAWQDLSNLPYRSPAFLKKMAQKAEVVSLDAGEQSSLLSLNESNP